MLAFIQGKIKHLGEDYLILENSGLGYQIDYPKKQLIGLKVGETMEFYLHEYLREEARELYGFRKIEELELFWRLLAISGIGPRLAQQIVFLGKLEDLVKNIEKGNADYICQVSGVGTKKAQKIIIELKGKLDLTGTGHEDDEVLQALKNLGYNSMQAREAVNKIPKEIQDISERVREALRYLSK